ncbi:histone-like nucleoid-structuring protein Lsr2 [Amycolatopsis anabasis]|uniref:histone-like nucleoid-structuring protein Lsr2 n=1 Tax=Amycolatopsis anabasis TaxID=1840409 RepID=UPI00131B9399|nr:Lsr2 family protein [Amycolatopsis anabasis]
MAQKVHVEMVDDLDGSEASQTVPFALDGVSYEIDLSDGNAKALREELARFAEAGRRIGGRKIRLATGQSATAAPSTADREKTRAVRAWAQANGYELAERGRIPAHIIEAHNAAQQAPAEPEPDADSKPARKRTIRKKKADAKA